MPMPTLIAQVHQRGIGSGAARSLDRGRAGVDLPAGHGVRLKAARVLDLYAHRWAARRPTDDEYVISADEKSG